MSKGMLLARGHPWAFALQGRTGQQVFGYNEHLGQAYDAHVNVANTARSLNCRVWRDGASWGYLEVAPGDFSGMASRAEHTEIKSVLAMQRAAAYDCWMYYSVLYVGYPNSDKNPMFYEPIWDIHSTIWRSKVTNYAVALANDLLSSGLPANRLVFGLDNEQNSNWPYGHQAGTNPVDWAAFTTLCYEMRVAVKAVNSAIRIAWGDLVDGDHGFYDTWRAANEAEPHYFASMDVLTNHLYSTVHPSLAPPEDLFDRCAPYFAAQLAAAAGQGRTDITTGVTECGGGPAEVPDVERWPRHSRMPWIFSLLPGFEFYIHYAGRDIVNDYGIMESDAFTLRYDANILGDSFAHLNLATARQKWTDPRGGIAIKLTVPAGAGGERLGLWNLHGNTMARLLVNASAPCNLRIKSMGGITDTRAIGAGLSNIGSVKMTPWAQAVYTDTPGVTISFPELG